MLCRQPVLRGGRGEAEIIGIGDPAGPGQEIAVSQHIRAPLGRYQQILAPRCALQPTLAAQGLDHMVRRLLAAAHQFDNLGPRRFASSAFRQRENNLTFLGR